MNGCKDLRHALGQFATGVTVITTCDANDQPVGVTANSFSSISLEPPMVLWALDKAAYSRDAFGDSNRFCVHVLTADQLEVSQVFATQGADKFERVDWTLGAHGMPHFNEFMARFCCRVSETLDIGDHVVYVGEVLDFEVRHRRPLVFFSGNYAHAERRISGWESDSGASDGKAKFGRRQTD